MIDTGCTHTLLDHELCQQLDIEIHPEAADIQLGGKDQVIPATGRVKNITIRHGNKQVTGVSLTLAHLSERVM